MRLIVPCLRARICRLKTVLPARAAHLKRAGDNIQFGRKGGTKTQNAVILTKRESLLGTLNRREILRFAQNDKTTAG
jgi:hypothetical protein